MFYLQIFKIQMNKYITVSSLMAIVNNIKKMVNILVVIQGSLIAVFNIFTA